MAQGGGRQRVAGQGGGGQGRVTVGALELGLGTAQGSLEIGIAQGGLQGGVVER